MSDTHSNIPIYWADLAQQIADVWWHMHRVGGSLQHNNPLSEATSFSVVLENHGGGRCFHAETPLDAWHKAQKWLESPDREYEVPLTTTAP